MSKSFRFPVLFASCSAILICGQAVRGQAILNDIWEGVQQARDRATQARDRATQARDGVNAVRARIDTAVATFTSTVQTFVNESVEDLRREIDAELEGRAEFVGNAATCSQFRSRMVLMLTDLESISNSILRTSACTQGIQVDYSREIALLQDLPCRMLYSLYRLLEDELHLFDSNLLDCLRQTAADLEFAAEFFVDDLKNLVDADETVLDARALLESQLEKSEWTLDRVTRLQKAASNLSGLSIAVKIVGKGFSAAGETQFTGEAQIHGYVGGSIKNNRKKKIGEALGGISDALKGVSDFLTNKTRFAITLSTQNLILTTMDANQKKILDNQDRILAALGAGPSPGLPMPGTCGVATMTMLPLFGIGFMAIRLVRKRRYGADEAASEKVTP